MCDALFCAKTFRPIDNLLLKTGKLFYSIKKNVRFILQLYTTSKSINHIEIYNIKYHYSIYICITARYSQEHY